MAEAGHVLVVGAGPAGTAAALAARRLGARVTLVERAFAGGNAVAHSLLPSKVHILAAHDIAAHASWGLGGGGEGTMWAVGSHLRWRRETARSAYEKALDGAGVERLNGPLRFVSPTAARAETPDGGVDIAFGAAVVATGSVQHVPAGLEPDGRRVLLPRDLASLAAPPTHAVVLGAGATGVEIASMLALYGGRVTLVGRAPFLLPGEDPVLAARLGRALVRRGVDLRLGQAAVAFDLGPDDVSVALSDGTRLAAGVVFVATGRLGATVGLNIEAAGGAVGGGGWAEVDRWGRVLGAATLFAAGDVTGAPLVANKAQAQGAAAGYWAARAAAGDMGTPDGEGPTFDARTLPVAVFAEPEYARVGAVPGTAGAERVLEGSDLASLRRHVLGQEEAAGWVRVGVDADGRIAGAAILGESASERILVLAAAMAWDVSARRLSALWPVVPSAGEALRALGHVPETGGQQEE